MFRKLQTKQKGKFVLLSITPNISTKIPIPSKKTVKSFAGADISDIISKGNQALNSNKYEEALKYYQQANQINSEEKSVYRRLGKAYFGLKNYDKAEENYKKYLETSPNDSECLIDLGEAQRLGGYYKKAITTFEKAYSLDNSNDLARRKILETKNNEMSIYSPLQAKSQKNEYASQNLKKALDMTIAYMGNDYMKTLSDVSICFGETASMGGTANIAQWENSKNTITVSDSYIYASPQVIAAYLSHECVHAHDKDGYTSVKEEQDAYEVAAKFWIKNAKGIKDPEMDYAADLYKQSPSDLSSRVKEIYELRDPSISQTSPNHPPTTKSFSFRLPKKQAANQPIKQYDVIA